METEAAPDQPRRVLLIANGNPLSRDAAGAAGRLLGQLQSALTPPVELVTTEYAGHAGEIASRFAEAYPGGLLIAVGGDGTLNEVVNAVMAARDAESRPALAVYPAGNANDQFRSWRLRADAFVDVVRTGRTAPVDVLELSYASRSGDSGRRWALSYMAVGFLANAAVVIDERKRGPLANLVVVPVTLRRSRPVTLTLAGRALTLDSLSWHIVPTMAKFLHVSSNARRDDGLMEVITVRHRRGLRWVRIPWLAARAVVGLGRQEQEAAMSFHWSDGGEVQLDGESLQVPPESDVSIACLRGAVTMLCGPPASRRRRRRWSGRAAGPPQSV